jgi:hypothetical protein
MRRFDLRTARKLFNNSLSLTAKVYGISGSWTMSWEKTYKKRGGIWVRIS